MTLETVTLQLPQTIYRRVKSQAIQKHRSVEDELVSVVTDALPVSDTFGDDLEQLTFLTDEELWQAAKMTFSQVEATRMQELVWQRQAGKLTGAEQDEIEILLSRYRRMMLVRAKSAVLLKGRGFDISILLQSPNILE